MCEIMKNALFFCIFVGTEDVPVVVKLFRITDLIW